MSDKKRWIIFTLANLIIINWAVIAYLNLKYPFVGHDYILGIPSILDSALHFRLNGLSIQWFTSSFGGGIPAFPNPNNEQFSLTVLLAIFFPPWQAVILSVILYISVGFVACEYFFRHTLKLNWTSSMLGAVFFSANGFMMERVAAGHMGYFTLPLLALFLIALFDSSLPVIVGASILGLLIALLLHYAGYFILVIFGFSILIIIPMFYILDPAMIDWKKLAARISLGGVIGLLISLSKLSAVYSFMRFFPRMISDHYDTPFLLAVFGLILQLLGTMSLAPLFLLVGINPDMLSNYILAATRADYGFWEVDMSVTPIVFIILLIGLDIFFHHPKKYLSRLLGGKKIFAFLLLLLALWLTVEFTLAQGVFYPILRYLPILSSLHVNVRFAAAFIFPFALVAALIYDKWIRTQLVSKQLVIFLVVNILAVLPLGVYFIYRQDLIFRLYDIRDGQKVFERMQSGSSFEMLTVGQSKDNTDALLTGVTNLNLYEPVFGYGLEYFHPQLHEGSVWDASNGTYNLTDPTGYVYPEVNNNQPFSRFRVEDKKALELFVNHIQPKWKIPVYQIVANWVSGLSFLIAAIYLLYYFFRHTLFTKL